MYRTSIRFIAMLFSFSLVFGDPQLAIAVVRDKIIPYQDNFHSQALAPELVISPQSVITIPTQGLRDRANVRTLQQPLRTKDKALFTRRMFSFLVGATAFLQGQENSTNAERKHMQSRIHELLSPNTRDVAANDILVLSAKYADLQSELLKFLIDEYLRQLSEAQRSANDISRQHQETAQFMNVVLSRVLQQPGSLQALCNLWRFSAGSFRKEALRRIRMTVENLNSDALADILFPVQDLVTAVHEPGLEDDAIFILGQTFNDENRENLLNFFFPQIYSAELLRDDRTKAALEFGLQRLVNTQTMLDYLGEQGRTDHRFEAIVAELLAKRQDLSSAKASERAIETLTNIPAVHPVQIENILRILKAVQLDATFLIKDFQFGYLIRYGFDTKYADLIDQLLNRLGTLDDRLKLFGVNENPEFRHQLAVLLRYSPELGRLGDNQQAFVASLALLEQPDQYTTVVRTWNEIAMSNPVVLRIITEGLLWISMRFYRLPNDDGTIKPINDILDALPNAVKDLSVFENANSSQFDRLQALKHLEENSRTSFWLIRGESYRKMIGMLNDPQMVGSIIWLAGYPPTPEDRLTYLKRLIQIKLSNLIPDDAIRSQVDFRISAAANELETMLTDAQVKDAIIEISADNQAWSDVHFSPESVESVLQSAQSTNQSTKRFARSFLDKVNLEPELEEIILQQRSSNDVSSGLGATPQEPTVIASFIDRREAASDFLDLLDDETTPLLSSNRFFYFLSRTPGLQMAKLTENSLNRLYEAFGNPLFTADIAQILGSITMSDVPQRSALLSQLIRARLQAELQGEAQNVNLLDGSLRSAIGRDNNFQALRLLYDTTLDYRIQDEAKKLLEAQGIKLADGGRSVIAMSERDTNPTFSRRKLFFSRMESSKMGLSIIAFIAMAGSLMNGSVISSFISSESLRSATHHSQRFGSQPLISQSA